MDCLQKPQIKIEKKPITTIYLDTCAMIELSRHEKGKCKIEHKQEIGELHDVLTALMCEKRILCPSGNQMQEMGMTEERKPARVFLHRFTNCELLHPDLVLTAQMQVGYCAFAKNNTTIELNMHTTFKENRYPDSPIVIHVNSLYSPEKADELRREKNNVAAVLNEMKTKKMVRANFEEQLRAELEAEYISFLSALQEPMVSEKALMRYLEETSRFCRITRFSPSQDSQQQFNHLAQYISFLSSPYHHTLPYIWIRANLWARRMQQPDKIKQGDNLDTVWAAAYLPFVDYAVTDNAFCELLQTSGLAELYGTKVYSFKTLRNLLDDLSCLT